MRFRRRGRAGRRFGRRRFGRRSFSRRRRMVRRTRGSRIGIRM